MKDLYYGFKTVDQPPVSIAICLELLGFVSEDIEDHIGGVAILEDLGRGMCCEVDARLFGIFGQRGIENGFEGGRAVCC